MKKNNLKNKIKKILFMLPILIVCFVLIFAFPVSALNVYQCPFQKPQANELSGYIEVYFGDLNSNVNRVGVYWWSFITADEYIDYKPYGTVNVSSNGLSVNFQQINTGGVPSPMYLAYGCWVSDGYTTSNYVNYLFNDYTLDIYSTMTPAVFNYFGVTNIRVYGNAEVSSNSFNTIENSNKWTVSYGGDSSIIEKLDLIASILQSQQNNTQQQIQNDNANTDKITGSINDGFNEIANGGKDYGTVDKSQSDNYIAQEEALNASISDSTSATKSLFSRFGSIFTGSKLSRGLLSVTAMINKLFEVNYLSDIINFSLMLGAFSFVIGASVLVVKSRNK